MHALVWIAMSVLPDDMRRKDKYESDVKRLSNCLRWALHDPLTSAETRPAAKHCAGVEVQCYAYAPTSVCTTHFFSLVICSVSSVGRAFGCYTPSSVQHGHRIPKGLRWSPTGIPSGFRLLSRPCCGQVASLHYMWMILAKCEIRVYSSAVSVIYTEDDSTFRLNNQPGADDE